MVPSLNFCLYHYKLTDKHISSKLYIIFLSCDNITNSQTMKIWYMNFICRCALRRSVLPEICAAPLALKSCHTATKSW